MLTPVELGEGGSEGGSEGTEIGSGVGNLARLRAMPALARTVLVAVTGWGSEEDQQRARDAGFDHHFTKPIAAETVSRLLGQL